MYKVGRRKEGKRKEKNRSPLFPQLSASFLRTALATAAVVGALGTGALLASSAERSTLSSRARDLRSTGRAEAGAANASCQMNA